MSQPSPSPYRPSPYRPDLVQDYCVLITGGGTGINFGIASEFAKHGANLAIMGRRLPVLEAACVQLRALGAQAIPLQGDVRDYAACEKAVATTVAKFGKIDVLINGAAGNFLAPAETLSSNGFKTVYEIDVFGTFNMSRAAVSTLKKNPKGTLIINITATLDIIRQAWQIHASSAKVAIESMTRHFAAEWGKYGIRACAIAPGFIEATEGFDRLGGFAMGADGGKLFLEQIPNGRFGKAQDIGYAALYIASDAGNYVNGEVLIVDGGQCIYKKPEITQQQLTQITQQLRAKKTAKL